jgi:16S rRNA A1518/A1519 N6-dimethyltransferase RsmA/KsgA/DIM1 with predicted DNA glycosylase/AP lyase activity
MWPTTAKSPTSWASPPPRPQSAVIPRRPPARSTARCADRRQGLRAGCAILAERRAILEDTARDLLARETLDEADLKAIHDRVTAEA